jgi:hypothetical protein
MLASGASAVALTQFEVLATFMSDAPAPITMAHYTSDAFASLVGQVFSFREQRFRFHGR